MSKFIKNLKSLFVVDEGGPKPQTPKKKVSNAQPKTIPQPKKTTIPTSSIPGKVEEKFMNVLLQALEKANLEGYDYLEYKNAIKSLEKMNMDEATRFKSAYTLAQTMGVTPQKLEESARYYIDVLKKEDSKFQNALQSQTQNNITKRNETISTTLKAIEENKNHISTLHEEIKRQEQQIEKLKKEVEGNKLKVSSAHGNFVASYQLLVNKIESDIQKMKQYLK